jgi:hypothetical protein
VPDDSGQHHLERYAKEAANTLRARGEATRGPRLPCTTTEEISEGLFGLRRRTVTHNDDGGSPRFWIIGAHRADGVQALYHPRPESQTRGHSWMAGNAAILLENGSLGSASWREDPIGSYWVISDIREMRLSGGTTMLDRADKGWWEKTQSSGREQYCEKFERRYVANKRPELEFYQSLKRLHNGTGFRMDDDVATGMLARPRGPEWSL